MSLSAARKRCAVDVPLDLAHQIPRADAREQQKDIDLPRDDPIGKVDGRLIVAQRHLAHRGTNQRHAVTPGDHAAHIIGAATFKRGHTQSGK